MKVSVEQLLTLDPLSLLFLLILKLQPPATFEFLSKVALPHWRTMAAEEPQVCLACKQKEGDNDKETSAFRTAAYM